MDGGLPRRGRPGDAARGRVPRAARRGALRPVPRPERRLEVPALQAARARARAPAGGGAGRLSVACGAACHDPEGRCAVTGLPSCEALIAASRAAGAGVRAAVERLDALLAAHAAKRPACAAGAAASKPPPAPASAAERDAALVRAARLQSGRAARAARPRRRAAEPSADAA